MAETVPLVGVIMGSKSDWDTMSQTDTILTEFGVPHECQVMSAHRTPALTAEYASTAASRGLAVIIAGIVTVGAGSYTTAVTAINVALTNYVAAIGINQCHGHNKQRAH